MANPPVRKPLPATGTGRVSQQDLLEKEQWLARVVYGASEREWAFTCDGVVVEEIRKAMLEGRPAHLVYAGTEAILNPRHIASVEFQRQPQDGAKP